MVERDDEMMMCGLTGKKMICGLLLVILISVPACSAAGELISDPTTLSFFLNRGENATRTVYLKNTDPAQNATNLSIKGSDLVTKDSMKFIPASAITTGLQAEVMEPKGYLTFPVNIKSGTSESGSYSGNLIINSNLSSLTLPVTVNVREPPVLPLVVLIVSTLFSVAFYDFATRGEKRARLKIKIRDLQDKLLNEPCFKPVSSGVEPRDSFNQWEYTRYFHDAIKLPLNTSEENLKHPAAEDMTVAETKYTEAYTAWDNWISNRQMWRDCLEKTKKNLQNLDKLSAKVSGDLNGQRLPFNGAIQDEVQKAWWDSANPSKKKSPSDLSTAISDLDDLIAGFSYIHASIRTFIRECEHLGDEQRKKGEKLGTERLERLLATRFRDAASLNTFREEFEKSKDEFLKTAGISGQPARFTVEALTTIPGIFGRMPAGYKPGKRAAEDKDISESAWIKTIRTWWARNITPVTRFIRSIWPPLSLTLYDQLHAIWIPAVLLIILGYSQLYEPKPAFGANLIADYSTLVIWGFATGPASDSIVTIIKDKTTLKTS